jgi:hypothetical protein
MTASKFLAGVGKDRAFLARIAILTVGLPLLSSDPAIFDIRRETRTVGSRIPNSHQVERPLPPLARSSLVRRLRGSTERKLLSRDVNQQVLTEVGTFQDEFVMLVYLTPDPGNILG